MEKRSVERDSAPLNNNQIMTSSLKFDKMNTDRPMKINDLTRRKSRNDLMGILTTTGSSNFLPGADARTSRDITFQIPHSNKIPKTSGSSLKKLSTPKLLSL